MDGLDNKEQIFGDGYLFYNLNENFNYYFSRLRRFLPKKDVQEIQFCIKELKSNWETGEYYSSKYPDLDMIRDFQYTVLSLAKENFPKTIYNKIYSKRKEAWEAKQEQRITAHSL